MKKKFDKLEKYKEELWKLAQKIDMDEETFNKIFKIIVDAGLYLFNKSHKMSVALYSDI